MVKKAEFAWGYREAKKMMADGGKVDAAQDKSMMARHNKLMHPGQKSKMNCGGKVKKGK